MTASLEAIERIRRMVDSAEPWDDGSPNVHDDRMLSGGGTKCKGSSGGKGSKPSPDAHTGAEPALATAREQQRKRSQEIGDGTADAPPLAEVMTLDQMLQELVFISDGSRVAWRARPHITLPLSEFKLHTKASEFKVGRKVTATADLWIQDPGRITTHTLTFRPGHGEFTTAPDGEPALNLWKPRERPESTESPDPFLDHIAYLVPDISERERFLDWLAHIEQFPGVLPHTHYLMVTPQTGIGRNWLASVLARVWSGGTRLGFDLVGAMNSGFNGPLSRRLLVIVDELKAADSGYGAVNHAQQLKAMLTTEHRGINPKYGRQHVEFNCARWLMFSQHYDALPLEHADRRVIVITNPTERRPVEYYRHLYSLLDDAAFINAVAQHLAHRDIYDFNPSEPAPLTESKKKGHRGVHGRCRAPSSGTAQRHEPATDDVSRHRRIPLRLRRTGPARSRHVGRVYRSGSRALRQARNAARQPSRGGVLQMLPGETEEQALERAEREGKRGSFLISPAAMSAVEWEAAAVESMRDQAVRADEWARQFEREHAPAAPEPPPLRLVR